VIITFGLLVAACSGASTSAGPSAGSPAAPTQATAGPSAEPTAEASATATSGEPADTSNWVAFREKIVPFTKTFSTDIQAMTQQLIDGDKAAASATAARLHEQAAEYLAWLDAHPADPCYRASWDPLHEALEDALKGTKSYAAGDFEAGSDDLMTAGSEMIDAGGTIMDSGDRCRS
jgi:hypothetical protein